MQLLVSVADAADAAAAVDGGADIIDAKDPSRGPLGPVTPDTLSAILAAVAGRRPVSAALGDGTEPGPLGGVAFVKLTTPRAIRGCDVIVAAYADAPGWHDVIRVALDHGAKGVLLDTHDKQGPGLFRLLSEAAISEWVDAAHDVGLIVALAGRLTREDLPRALALGADIAGVRGAVCEGGRGGRVSIEKVRAIAQREISAMPVSL